MYHLSISMRSGRNTFFFHMSFSKCICLICQSIAISNKGNVERHFRTLHKNDKNDFPARSELRRTKVRELKLTLTGQQSLFTRPGLKAKAVTEASFRVKSYHRQTKKKLCVLVGRSHCVYHFKSRSSSKKVWAPLV